VPTPVQCGASFQDFREAAGWVAQCYQAFEAPLGSAPAAAAPPTREGHAEPGQAPVPEERPRAAADLREQLRLAVETENFELAAELRDRLRVME
jgi:protein arginine kinase activator